MLKRNIIVVTILSLFSIGSMLLTPNFSHAQANEAICEGIGAVQGGDTCQDESGSSLSNTVEVVLNILSIIAGIIAVIMLVVSGIRYITSGGDSSAVSGAKNAIIYAVIGIVIVVLSQLIVLFVLNRATSTTNTNVVEQPRRDCTQPGTPRCTPD